MRGVLAPKAVRDFWGLEAAGGLSSLLFSCQRGSSHCTCGAAINRVHPKDLEQWVDLGGRVPPAAPPRGWVVPDGGFADASAAFPGMVWPTLRGLDVINNIPSLENLSSSSEGITSGPVASAAAFAVARRGRFFQRLTPSRFKETRGNFPPVLPPLDCLPPPDCHPPSHLRCSPCPFSGWGRTSELSWGPFFFYSILAGSRMLLGKKVMSWQVLFPQKIQGGIGAGTVSTVPYLKLS
jgi:hypothetical protein